MNDQSRRKALRASYEQVQSEAGVYRIRNGRNGKALLGSTPDLASLRHKLEFAQATNTPSALDWRLVADARAHGLAVFSLEVLEALATTPEMTRAEILADLAILEQLWREQLDSSLLY